MDIYKPETNKKKWQHKKENTEKLGNMSKKMAEN